MKHIAIRSRSIHLGGERRYTAPGLGDRIHSVTIGWVWGQAHKTPVTLHLDAKKMTRDKPESWAEVISLFPRGAVQIKPHDYAPDNENDWLKYLMDRGIDADIHTYLDHIDTHDFPIDISPYFKQIPQIDAEPQNIDLPDRFVTVQWDSSAQSRTLLPGTRELVLGRYRDEYGCDAVVVGGEAKNPNLKRLKYAAYAMSRAEYHVGVDSAYLHMAPLYLPWDRVHMYNETKKVWSHHMMRAIDNGAKVNLHL